MTTRKHMSEYSPKELSDIMIDALKSTLEIAQQLTYKHNMCADCARKIASSLLIGVSDSYKLELSDQNALDTFKKVYSTENIEKNFKAKELRKQIRDLENNSGSWDKSTEDFFEKLSQAINSGRITSLTTEEFLSLLKGKKL